jgi:hypothetical protein
MFYYELEKPQTQIVVEFGVFLFEKSFENHNSKFDLRLQFIPNAFLL